jgi:hypothetical protein
MRGRSQRHESVPWRARLSIRWRDYTLGQRAKRHAKDFVGMSLEEAQAHADRLNLVLRLGSAGALTSDDYATGRVTAAVRDGVIVTASDG